MSGLFDIGRTGIETYKHALSVTGQNIANAGTEGYHRREVLVAERKLTQSDSLSIQDQLGLGAEVDKVSRAFDTLSFFKLIKTNSALESAKTVSDNLVNLEKSVVSNNKNLFSDVNNFFEALNRVQGAPNEIPERQAAIIAAEQLATRMSTFAAELSDLKSNLLKEAKITVGTTNQVIDGLVEVQRSLQTVGATNFSPSSLLDQRDQLLMELSDNLDISIQYQESEKVRVGLGQNFGPNDLIDSFQYKELTLEANAEEIEFFLDGELTNDISGGRLGGILKVYDIVEQTIGNLNDYASTLANEFNQIQKAGVGLDGKQALNIFDIPTVEVLNSDGTASYLALSPDALLEDEYSLQYLKESNSFINIADNKEVQFDGGFLTLENKKLFIEDMPNDGETITIKPIANVAQNISVALKDPAQLAAAKSLSITNDTKNIGSALVTLTSSAISETAPQFSISEDFKGSTSAASAKSFISDLHVSLIDEDVSEINVGAFSEQSSARFPLTDAEIIDLKSGTISINLTDGADKIFDVAINPQWDDLASLSELLNKGVIESSDGEDIQSLGLVAIANQNTLTFTQSSNVTNPVNSIQLLDDTNQLLDETKNFADIAASNSDVYVFTKEGRQLSGPMLTDEQALELLTPANGFNSDAIYISDYVNDAYRGSYTEAKYFHGSPTEAYGFFTETVSDDGLVKKIDFSLDDEVFQTQLNVSTASSNNIDTHIVATLNDEFSTSLNFSEQPELELSNVSQHIASELRKISSAQASSSLTFDATSLGSIETFSVSFEGQSYSGKIVFPNSFDEDTSPSNIILEGVEDRFTPMLAKKADDSGFELTLSAKDGVPTAESIRIFSETANSTQTLSVQTDMVFDGFSEDLGELVLSDGRVINLGTMTSTGGVIDNFEITIEDNDSKAKIIISTTDIDTSFRYQPSEAVGIDTKIINQRIFSMQNGLTIESLNDQLENNLSIDINSNVRSLTNIKNLPDEELLLILQNTDDTKYSVDFSKRELPGRIPTNFKLTLKSAELGLYELSDANTGDSIATRFINSDGSIEFNGLKFEVKGTPAEGDSFFVSEAQGAELKSDNISEMLKLAQLGSSDGGEFNNKLDQLLFDLSKHVSSAEIYKEAAEGSKTAIEEAIDKFSSVSLDTEAANLMQQQQAYQALARVLSTAKELIETLMEVT